jgi:hypothetical protein
MEPVSIPASVRHVYRLMKGDLGDKCLILVHRIYTDELLLESPDSYYSFASQE